MENPTQPGRGHETTDRLADRAHEAVDSAARRAGDAEERVRRSGEQAQERSQDLLASVTDYVHENPLAALGLAFAAGTIFSAMTRKR